MKKVGLADWRTSNGLPSASDPETEADRTPRESSLACMTANREPSNQSFEIDREATVCTASRRFLPLCGRETARGTSLAGQFLFGRASDRCLLWVIHDCAEPAAGSAMSIVPPKAAVKSAQWHLPRRAFAG
jgi:hypothetical protein